MEKENNGFVAWIWFSGLALVLNGVDPFPLLPLTELVSIMHLFFQDTS